MVAEVRSIIEFIFYHKKPKRKFPLNAKNVFFLLSGTCRDRTSLGDDGFLFQKQLLKFGGTAVEGSEGDGMS